MLIALSLDLPRALYDSVAMTAFNVITGVIAGVATAPTRQGRGFADRHRGLQWGAVRLHGREPGHWRRARPALRGTAPDAIYGNNLAQQITSTFDVMICALTLAVLIAMLFTGPLAGYLVRRRDARVATASEAPKPPSPEPTTSAAPTIVRRSPPSEMPRIVRLKEDSTTVLPAPPTEEFSAPTAALRIQRREPSPNDSTTPPSGPVTGG